MDKPGQSSPQRESTEQLLLKLRQEHAMLEAELEGFNQRLYLGAREQMERKRLQKKSAPRHFATKISNACKAWPVHRVMKRPKAQP